MRINSGGTKTLRRERAMDKVDLVYDRDCNMSSPAGQRVEHRYVYLKELDRVGIWDRVSNPGRPAMMTEAELLATADEALWNERM